MTKTNYEISSWDLGDLLDSTETAYIDQLNADLESLTQNLEAKRETLTDDISQTDFEAFMASYEESLRVAYRLYAYSSLWFTTNTQSQEALGFKGKVEQLYLEFQNRTLFFELWWKGLEDSVAERILAHAGDIGYYLQQMRNLKPYTLSEAEEKIINLKKCERH